MPTTHDDWFPLESRWGSRRVNICSFGAVGDGVTDDTLAIQAAVDYAIENGLPSVYCPGGKIYRTTNTIHLGYGCGTAMSWQTCIWLEGDHPTYIGDGRAAATIRSDFIDRPIINIQGSRHSGVQHLVIECSVPFDEPGDPPWGAVTWTMETRATASNYYPHGAQVTTNTPFCGICIDGYCGPIPSSPYPTPPYPAFLGTVSMASGAYQRQASSNIQIFDCIIQNCHIGVLSKPNDDGNGDFLTVRNCTIQWLKIGISVGGSQARSNDFSNLNFFVVHTCFDGRDHSRTINGYMAGTYENLHLNWYYRIWNIFGNWSTSFVVQNVYSESGMRIGDFGSATPVRFVACRFDLREENSDSPDGAANDVWAEPCMTGTNATFVNCQLAYFRAGFVMLGGSAGTIFEDCTFNTFNYTPRSAPEMVALAAMGGVFLEQGFGNLVGPSHFRRCVAQLGGSAPTANVTMRLDLDQPNAPSTWHASGMSHYVYEPYDVVQLSRWTSIYADTFSISGRNLLCKIYSPVKPGDLFYGGNDANPKRANWYFLVSYNSSTNEAVLQAMTNYKKVGAAGPYVMHDTTIPGTLWYFNSAMLEIPVDATKFMVTTVGLPTVAIVNGSGAPVARPTQITVTSRPFYHGNNITDSYGDTRFPFPHTATVLSVQTNGFTMTENAVVTGTYRMCPGIVKLK